MGDKATEVDCAMFGMLSQFLWNCPGSPFEQLLNGNQIRFNVLNENFMNFQNLSGEFINLKMYCERMRDNFWPDWDRCLDSARISS